MSLNKILDPGVESEIPPGGGGWSLSNCRFHIFLKNKKNWDHIINYCTT